MIQQFYIQNRNVVHNFGLPDATCLITDPAQSQILYKSI